MIVDIHLTHQRMLKSQKMKTPELATIFGSLGQATRLEIIRLLAMIAMYTRDE